MELSIQEAVLEDAERIVGYFKNATNEQLNRMGAAIDLLPDETNWIKSIQTELLKGPEEKQLFYLIWYIDDVPVGHSNINKIRYGECANMHLHMWQSTNRRKGLAVKFLQKCIPKYFEYFQLKELICEPYARNPAPVKTLESLGFEFERIYQTVPGAICFPQEVRRFILKHKHANYKV